MSAENALMNFSQNYIKKNNRQKKTNKKPEAEIVKNICNWLRDNGFSHDVVEGAGGRNKFGVVTVKAGFTDIVSCDKNGYACYIEAKAKGRRSTLKGHQREFILRKIRNNAFAVCVDCHKKLEFIYNTWIMLRERNDTKKAQEFLVEMLPTKRQVTETVDEEFGF